MMRFYLGTHRLCFLKDTRFAGVPLFVSARVVRAAKALPRAVTDWALDSGGFTELTLFGRWETSARRYAAEVLAWGAGIGRLQWAAPQDWMCEEFVCASTALAEGLVSPDPRKIRGVHKTRAAFRTAQVKACLPLAPELWRDRVREHQRRTVANYLELRRLAPAAPFVPVLQGYAVADYMSHVDQYAAAGVDLAALPLVGVGSVCRRQASEEAAGIVRAVRARGIRPHGFGFKTDGLRRAGASLESADSLAWSFGARFADPLPGCRHGKTGRGKCNNCPLYALKWLAENIGSRPEVAPDSDLFGELL